MNTRWNSYKVAESASAAAGTDQRPGRRPDARWCGLAGTPGKEAEFASGLQQCLHYATQLGVEAVNILPGRLAEGCSRQQALDTLHANLQLAATALAAQQIRCTVEAINRHDMPGFLISTLDELQQLPDHPNLFWQIDLYHMARMGEALAPCWRSTGNALATCSLPTSPARRSGQRHAGLCQLVQSNQGPALCLLERRRIP
jgi:hydroxypyruvate isomerase